MEIWWERLGSFSSVFLRRALGLGFLSAVADRLGRWGPLCRPNVALGNFARFGELTVKLNWFLPRTLLLAFAVTSTIAEILLSFLLLVGWKTRITALCAGVLLVTFGTAMTMALGFEAPLDFSVFSAAGGSLLLAACTRFPFSADQLNRRAATRP
jgi:uncharacterized membrane protein YphA (DoxX/SURF4 family)